MSLAVAAILVGSVKIDAVMLSRGEANSELVIGWMVGGGGLACRVEGNVIEMGIWKYLMRIKQSR